MIEILKFIFQDFWHWLGSFLIIIVIADGIGSLITKVRGANKE